MEIKLNNNKYIFLTGYQNDNKYRAAFNHLSVKTFGLSFEDWYSSGYWREKYIPYTLFDGNKAISNISVNIMAFSAFGKQQRFIQLGTVMTDENYRNKNLNRFLMEKVLEEWNPKCDFIYLFANSYVLEFYPKFGFDRAKEYEYFKPIVQHDKAGDLEKINMGMQSNRDMLHDYAKNTKVFGKLSMQENADLVLFYCITILKENVYYIKSLDIIVIIKFNNKQLHLLDIFGKTKVGLDTIVDCLSHLPADQILLGFTPDDCSTYEVREISGDDALFIQQGKADLFDKNKVMFPLLSHA